MTSHWHCPQHAPTPGARQNSGEPPTLSSISHPSEGDTFWNYFNHWRFRLFLMPHSPLHNLPYKSDPIGPFDSHKAISPFLNLSRYWMEMAYLWFGSFSSKEEAKEADWKEATEMAITPSLSHKRRWLFFLFSLIFLQTLNSEYPNDGSWNSSKTRSFVTIPMFCPVSNCDHDHSRGRYERLSYSKEVQG